MKGDPLPPKGDPLPPKGSEIERASMVFAVCYETGTIGEPSPLSAAQLHVANLLGIAEAGLEQGTFVPLAPEKLAALIGSDVIVSSCF